MSNTLERDERYKRAERALEEYFELQGGPEGSGLIFEVFLARYPDLVSELRELHGLCGQVDQALERGQQTFNAQQAEIRRMLSDLDSAEFNQRYVVQGEVGKGGMGVVYRVVDRKLDRPLAMKVILGQVEASRSGKTPPLAPRQLARFLNEAKITGQLDHPGIVPVHEVGVDDEGRAYFTMKLVKGRTLGEVFDARAAKDPEWSTARVLGVIQRVCEALAFAHDRGVIHRDLKPANVMVGDFGEVYVMDWGLARRLEEKEEPAPADVAVEEELSAQLTLTREGQLLGTPAYMSPEQASGQLARMGPHSDVYAIGAMLYQLIAGNPPYTKANERPSAAQVVARILWGEPEPLPEAAAPPELIAISRKAMARDLSTRYVSMEALAGELRAFLEERVVRAYRTGAWEELVKWTRRNRGTAAALAAALVALLGGALAVAVLERANAKRERELAAQIDAEKSTALKALDAEHQALAIAETETEKARKELKTRKQTIALMDDLFRAPRPERAQGKEVTVREILDHAREKLEGGKVTEPEVLGTLQVTLGFTHQSLGDYDRSIELLSAGTKHLEAALGPSHSDVLSGKRGLAESLKRKDRLEEAIALSREILDASRAALGQDDIETMFAMKDLGAHLRAAGQIEEASALLEEAYQRCAARFGPKDSRTLAMGQNLMPVLVSAERLEEALELARAILEKRRTSEGELSPEALYAMDNLGIVLSESGRFQEAEELIRASFDGMLRVLGPDHEHTYYASNNLGLIYFETGRLDKAREQLEFTLANRERLLGPGHHLTLRTRDSLIEVQMASGNLDEAQRLSSASYAFARDPGTSVTTRMLIIRNHGALQERRGDLEAAVAFFEEAYALQTQSGVPESEVVDVLESLVRVQLARNDLDAASHRFEELLEFASDDQAARLDALALELDAARAVEAGSAPSSGE